MKLLKDIEEKKVAYECFQGEYDRQEAVYKAEVFKVSKKYEAMADEAFGRYKAEVEQLNAERNGEIAQIPGIAINPELVAEEKTALKKLIQENKIDHDLMCKLLKKKTGLLWDEKPLTGVCRDWESGGQMSRYGVVLMNERHPKFNCLIASYDENQRPQDESNMIFVRIGAAWPVEEAIKGRNYAYDYNWLLTYLDAKGLLPSYEHPAHLANCREFGAIVVEAIEEYLQGKEAKKATDSEEEIEKA